MVKLVILSITLGSISLRLTAASMFSAVVNVKTQEVMFFPINQGDQTILKAGDVYHLGDHKIESDIDDNGLQQVLPLIPGEIDFVWLRSFFSAAADIDAGALFRSELLEIFRGDGLISPITISNTGFIERRDSDFINEWGVSKGQAD